METKIFYDAPRSISIGDIFYVIDARERNDFSSPCRVCNDEKKLTVNGITFDCPVCGGYRSRETVVSVQHFTVATVKVYVIKQEVSTDYWTIQNYRDLHFRVFRKRGHGYNGDGNNFTRDFTSNNIKNNLNTLPDEKFLQIYSQDGYFARNCEHFIFDDYKLACRAAVMTKTNKESKYIVACQNCMLPVSKCKGDCTRKQILKNAANADKTEVKNGKHKAP